VTARDGYEDLIEELVGAIELRECGDPDGSPWAAASRIRRLEQQLLEEHRRRPGRWTSGDDLASRLAGRDEGLPQRTRDLVGTSA
jgi:hypothetical protein